jgi:hypothetical protein
MQLPAMSGSADAWTFVSQDPSGDAGLVSFRRQVVATHPHFNREAAESVLPISKLLVFHHDEFNRSAVVKRDGSAVKGTDARANLRRD